MMAVLIILGSVAIVALMVRDAKREATRRCPGDSHEWLDTLRQFADESETTITQQKTPAARTNETTGVEPMNRAI